MNQDRISTFKQQAAHEAVRHITSGMVVGLGSGSTTRFALARIAEHLRSGALSDILGVPTSCVVAAEARRLDIPLCPDDDPPAVDLTIDGADEVDPALNVIKGGGGALVREKLVAQWSRREIIIVDESKLSPRLGTRSALPVEVIQFGWKAQRRFLESLGARVTLRTTSGGDPFVSDQGNYVLDAAFGPIADPVTLADEIEARAGVVGQGLFLALATDLIVAGADGTQHLKRP